MCFRVFNYACCALLLLLLVPVGICVEVAECFLSLYHGRNGLLGTLRSVSLLSVLLFLFFRISRLQAFVFVSFFSASCAYYFFPYSLGRLGEEREWIRREKERRLEMRRLERERMLERERRREEDALTRKSASLLLFSITAGRTGFYLPEELRRLVWDGATRDTD